jgi:hypothetical protein
MTSLWAAPERETRELMTQFGEKWSFAKAEA